MIAESGPAVPLGGTSRLRGNHRRGGARAARTQHVGLLADLLERARPHPRGGSVVSPPPTARSSLAWANRSVASLIVVQPSSPSDITRRDRASWPLTLSRGHLCRRATPGPRMWADPAGPSRTTRPPAHTANPTGPAGRHLGQAPWRFVIVWVVFTAAAFAVAVGGVTGESLFQRLHSGALGAERGADRSDLIEENEASAGQPDPGHRREPGRPRGPSPRHHRDPEPGYGPGVTSVTSPFLLPVVCRTPSRRAFLGGDPSAAVS